MSAPGPGTAASANRWRVAAGFCAVITFTFVAGYYVPTYREAARLRSERATLTEERAAANASVEQLQAAVGRLQADNAALRREVEAPKGDSADVARRIERLGQVLSAQFGRLAQARMMMVSSASDRVSVALAVPALFSTRDHLTKSGRTLLCQLAKTIMNDYKGQIRVTGYYGKPRLEAVDGGPHASTPWHLSAARAASAADALTDDCGAPPDRFLVVGYGPRVAGPLGENVALEFIFKSDD